MPINNRASTGISGLDQVIDMLRLGDNVVWQVSTLSEYQRVITPYVRQARQENRRLIYIRFGSHLPLLEEEETDRLYVLDASKGFEDFATRVHQIIEEEGTQVFYVFDCLSDLLEHWYSDLMVGNFFRVTCPLLYKLNTVAYFALMRGTHTYNTIARIRETTQLLLDLYRISGKSYIHPLKVWERYSPTMFFPHLIDGDRAVSVTASAEAATLFSGQWRPKQAQDFWESTLDRARAALMGGPREQEQMKNLLISLIMGRENAIAKLAIRYFTLTDLLYVASREIGTGYIGGKSVGFLLARRILEHDAFDTLHEQMEPHDSYYLGSDVFYTYIVQNKCWNLRMKQKTPEGYFSLAGALQEKLLQGKFPENIREQFMQMLEYFGQSPIIVRSSSLQEDNYGNAFAGKYESVFCANQGSPEERCREFEQAVRRVYASTMNENALRYRLDRGLENKDEQMAVLVQRVSGDHYGDLFFPHVAGVANSVNLYLWEQGMDPSAGMMRLVFGLGTRAVERVSGDYARIVALDRPEKNPPVNYGEEAKFSQHKADVLNLRENRMQVVPVNRIAAGDLKTDKTLFFSPDRELIGRMREMGQTLSAPPVITDFPGLLGKSTFPQIMHRILSKLQQAYAYPVDLEFAVNFTKDGLYKINLLQCRPLQAKGLGAAVSLSSPDDERIILQTSGNFMGGNIHVSIDYVIWVKPEEYLALTEREKYQAARTIGCLNRKLGGHQVLLIGPGRWGTTTPSLGVPVHFTELSRMTAICEVAYHDMTPELSFGSHFFQDLVESGIFYAAVHGGSEEGEFHPHRLPAGQEEGELWEGCDSTVRQALYLAATPGLCLHSDIVSQSVLCYFEDEQKK